jgi:hypothetical protein
MKIPLKDCDDATAEFIDEINTLIEQLCTIGNVDALQLLIFLVIDWMNSIEVEAYTTIRIQIDIALNDIFTGANDLIADIQSPLNEFARQLDSSLWVDIPVISTDSKLVVYPPNFIPSIPCILSYLPFLSLQYKTLLIKVCKFLLVYWV